MERPKVPSESLNLVPRFPLPRFLRPIQWVDFANNGFDLYFKELVVQDRLQWILVLLHVFFITSDIAVFQSVSLSLFFCEIYVFIT